MKQVTQRILPLILAFATASAYGQFYKTELHGGNISVGGTGQFTTPLTSSPLGGTYAIPSSTGGVQNETIFNQQQYTTLSAGLLASFEFHPVAWAGVEFNYGFTHYSERYTFNYSSSTATQTVNVPTTSHEVTGAYQFHPKRIPFQPFVNIGGGAIDFLPSAASNQWRGAGLLEAGFDIPVHNKHLALRVEGRTLVYRAPNFNNAVLSSRTWRSTEEPAVSFVYRF